VERPAVMVDHDGDVIGVVEGGGGGAREGRLVEVPLGRSELPDELGYVASVFGVAGPPMLGGKVILVPPGKLRRRRQGSWLAAGLPIRYPLTETRALQRSGQRAARMSAVRAPIKPAEQSPLDLQHVHGRQDVAPRPLAGDCVSCQWTGSASCRSPADTGRSPGSPPRPTLGRPRHSCGCCRISRSESAPPDRRQLQLPP